MWEKKDATKPQTAEPSARMNPPAQPATAALVNIGKSIVVKGELSGHEDLSIDGKVEGKVSLRDHNLTIGKHGRLQAELEAKRVIILGQVTGNVFASEKVEVMEGGCLEGDIVAPRLSIADGAHFRGKVDMDGADPAASASRSGEVTAVAAIASKAGA